VTATTPAATTEETTGGGSPATALALASECIAVLAERNETVATAESLTAGLISATLATVPGASAVLRGGIAAYASEVKVSVLGVDAGVVDEHGVISRECAVAMAEAARNMFRTAWAVAATGVAGPDRQEGRAVGTVYVAVAGSRTVSAEELSLSGARQAIRDDTVAAALRLLLTRCSSEETGSRVAGTFPAR
jgi:nicotinamide-nucleotide amidase